MQQLLLTKECHLKEHKAIIEKVNTETEEDTKTLFKNVFNRRKMKVRIKTLRGTNNLGLIVGPESKAVLTLITDEISNKHETSLWVRSIKKHQPIEIIKNIPEDIKKDEMVPVITEQNRLQEQDKAENHINK
ncbi:unnamed protein product [Nezara viridula]|uniref:Uncharacterized protein n=1 Tax=Nezara viridula TaxID=85310 RepID=A0A9P0E8A2_NEZVI|nr:unnamed protein product [Nezara viridula]